MSDRTHVSLAVPFLPFTMVHQLFGQAGVADLHRPQRSGQQQVGLFVKTASGGCSGPVGASLVVAVLQMLLRCSSKQALRVLAALHR
jgi:hypothetical protein